MYYDNVMMKQDEDAKEDYSHLPPNQQKKKLTEKIDTLKSSLAKHTAARSVDWVFIFKKQICFNVIHQGAALEWAIINQYNVAAVVKGRKSGFLS